MGNWYLVRHGETDWNKAGQIQGHVDVPLNARGRRQVSLLAERLKDVDFAAVYSSDLARTFESAQGVAAGRGITIATDPDLREFSYGEWEGLTMEEIEARNPGALAERIEVGNLAFAAPGGENTAQVLARVRRFCVRVAKRHDPLDDLLVVAHGGSIRALVVCLLDLADADFWRFRVDCTGLAVISDHPGCRILERWNDNSHLAGLDGGSPV